MIKVVSSFVYLVAIVFAFSKTAPAAEVAKVYTSFFPRVVMNDAQKPGVAYEIVVEIFKLADEKFEIEILPWARAQYMAKNTPGSLIFPLSRTLTREKNYDWSVNIFNNQTHFITFNKTKLTAQTARDKLIGVQLKSSWDNWLTEQGYKNIYRVPEEGSGLVKLLRNNRIDAWYTDQMIAGGVLKDLNDPNITYSDPIQIFHTFLATNKRAPYLHMNKLKAAMVTLRQSGKLDQIFEKYGITPNY
ncbi:MAG: transporter substrate-binding domain-containing protein [Methylocystaceae bacterium]|nr:transporter substrate-binding domain-containing protein [Methylocystaceae bacterium]